MKFSMLPLLYLIQIVAIYRVTKNTYGLGQISARQNKQIILILATLTLWGGLSTYLGMSGYYQSEDLLSSLPGLWIPTIPVLIVMIPWMASKDLRQGIDKIIDQTPLHLIMGFEGLRILALGGIIKGYRGEFSLFFAKFVGIPDFLYGVTTLIAAVLIYRGVWKERSAIIINLIGFIIIVPFAVILINVGLPGPLYMIEESPSLKTIFEFPMVLAPTLVVPIFAMVNLFVALRLIKR
ncbi:MAG: hypothetical protein V3T82_07290 [Nitrospinaceae bacterium]